MRLVGYLRVSTDDKGQDPLRQKDIIQAWADSQGHQVAYWCIDEGTSGSISPLERPKFQRAIREAKRLECEGIVVETVDRFTRGGVDDQGFARMTLTIEHGLRVVYADLPEGMEKWMEEVFQAILAAAARAWLEAHKKKVNAGILRAKAANWPNGKPGKDAKPDLNEQERAIVDDMLADGKGNRLIALRISKERGAFDVTDPKTRKQRMVSENWIRKQRSKCEATPNPPSRLLAPKNEVVRRTEPVESQEGA